MLEDNEFVRPLGRFLFPHIFRAFRISIQPTKLILAFLALATVCLTGRLMDFTGTVVVAPSGMTELDAYVSKSHSVQEHLDLFTESGTRTGVFTTLWHFGSQRFHEAILETFGADRDRDRIVDLPNSVAILEGSDPDLKHEYIVYSGHMDHVGPVLGVHPCRPVVWHAPQSYGTSSPGW